MMKSQSQALESAPNPKIFFIMPAQAPWWIWLTTACLLAVGLAGFTFGFVAAIALSILQSMVFFSRERQRFAFAVQLRVAYTLLLLVYFIPQICWLFWLPTVGILALSIFNCCLMASCLSLIPWNKRAPISIELLIRTFFSGPMIPIASEDSTESGYAGGVCSIEAQIWKPAVAPSRRDETTRRETVLACQRPRFEGLRNEKR